MDQWRTLYQNPQTARKDDATLDFNVLGRSPPTSELPGKETLFSKLREDVNDPPVIDAMELVPREHFVPPALKEAAYEDAALPIGEAQTISQPRIVAMMTSALSLTADETVLEIGTGSGYHAAVLSHLCHEVISIERIPILAQQAGSRLASLGVTNVRVYPAFQHLGWPAKAPYGAIVVTAAASKLPTSLVDQLAEGGRLVIPIGSQVEQELILFVKEDGELYPSLLTKCRFVPLIHTEALSED